VASVEAGHQLLERQEASKDVADWEALPAEKRRGSEPGQRPSSTGRTQTKLSRRKTALFRLRMAARTAGVVREVDGVR
jgi:hypothetical protein